MPNTYLNTSVILNEAMRILHNKCNFIKNINRQYDKSFVQDGSAGKPGTQLRIRLPNQYTIRTGLTANPQSTEEEVVTITRATQKHIAVEFTSEELTQHINDSGVKERVIKGFTADVLATNKAMLKVFEKTGLPFNSRLEDGIFHLTIPFSGSTI